MYYFKAPGIAASTAISGLALTIGCIFFFRKKHKFKIYFGNYFLFLTRHLIHLTLGVAIFLTTHITLCKLLSKTSWHNFFCISWGFWLFTIPLFLFTMVFLFLTKNVFNTRVYFLKK